MKVSTKYIVYELYELPLNYNNIYSHFEDDYKAIKETKFKGGIHKHFDTEEEAIQALIDEKKTYETYLIHKQIYITPQDS